MKEEHSHDSCSQQEAETIPPIIDDHDPSVDEYAVHGEKRQRTEESPGLRIDREDKIGAPFGKKTELALCASEKASPEQATCTDRNL